MGYRELELKPHPTLRIDGRDFDVDYFGMDDGLEDDPGSAFRFVFQLGFELMIYLYVIQAGGRGRQRHFFHTVWLKDCAVAWVEEKDQGPPTEVLASNLALPLTYLQVAVCGRARQRFAVGAQTFSAHPGEGRGQELIMRFELHPLPGHGEATSAGWLTWTRTGGWELEAPGLPARPLEADEWLEFTPPS